MAKKHNDPPALEPKVFRSTDEIDQGIAKLQRRIPELLTIDLSKVVRDDTGADHIVESNIRETIREVFGTNSPEFKEHAHIRIWAGGMYINMDPADVLDAKTRGRERVIGILNGLVLRLQEKRQDLVGGIQPAPSGYFDRLNLHPRILDVSRDLFLDGHHWEAVFAAAKALVNYVKERSGCHDRDGVSLMQTVFSRKNPLLAFNDLNDQTDVDEQEGMMHLFEGAVLGIRNPGGHTFPEGPEQRAVEYISLLSLLAYRVQEATKLKRP
jgi:uncharacterized protein (TIGR02391 family)